MCREAVLGGGEEERECKDCSKEAMHAECEAPGAAVHADVSARIKARAEQEGWDRQLSRVEVGGLSPPSLEEPQKLEAQGVLFCCFLYNCSMSS